MLTLNISLFLFLAGGFLALALGWRRQLAQTVGALGAIAGAITGFWAALGALHAEAPCLYSFPWRAAGINLVLNLDHLAAFFLLPIFLLTLCAAVYALAYLPAPMRRGQSGYHWFFFNLLAASMTLVVLAANGLLFLVAWEAMSLSSFFLVAFNYEEEEVRKAAWLYLIATHTGTICLFLLFLLAARLSGSLDFSSFAALQNLPLQTALPFFFLALLGFGTKAGLFPLHVWLPDAHSAAPSHVSALMSGVMIKTGIYGLLRLLTFLPALPAWCGLILIILGIAGAFFGIAMAAMQTDIKRSLAFSTVENIGIIFLGLGVSLFARAAGQPMAAALAMAGALLHIWNHALFKGLLFLGAGSLIHGVGGSRTLSKMGGLLRRMPMTAAMMVGGCIAIAALPPLNGFVSEWFIYMGMLHMGQMTAGPTALLFLALITLLAMVGGLVLLTFSRLAGIALAGEPRRPETAAAHESGWPMLLAMAMLLAFCLLIGLFPKISLWALAGPLAAFRGLDGAAALAQGLPFQKMSLVAALLFLLLGLGMLCRRHLRIIPRLPTWGCGFPRPASRMAYTAASYAELAQQTFLGCSLRAVFSPALPLELFPKQRRCAMVSEDPVFFRIFQPLFRYGAEKAVACRRLQAGQLNIYLLYIFITTTVLLGLIMYQL